MDPSDEPQARALSTEPMTWTFGTMMTKDMLVQPRDGGEPRLWLLPGPFGMGEAGGRGTP